MSFNIAYSVVAFLYYVYILDFHGNMLFIVITFDMYTLFGARKYIKVEKFLILFYLCAWLLQYGYIGVSHKILFGSLPFFVFFWCSVCNK